LLALVIDLSNFINGEAAGLDIASSPMFEVVDLRINFLRYRQRRFAFSEPLSGELKEGLFLEGASHVDAMSEDISLLLWCQRQNSAVDVEGSHVGDGVVSQYSIEILHPFFDNIVSVSRAESHDGIPFCGLGAVEFKEMMLVLVPSLEFGSFLPRLPYVIGLTRVICIIDEGRVVVERQLSLACISFGGDVTILV
jgi:hypothetical protein